MTCSILAGSPAVGQLEALDIRGCPGATAALLAELASGSGLGRCLVPRAYLNGRRLAAGISEVALERCSKHLAERSRTL